MASTSEKGHAKNIANAKLLNTYIIEIGSKYNPSNPQLLAENLQNIYSNSFTEQESVNTLVAPYSTAVTNREVIFKPLSKKITKLRKAYKATEGVTQDQLEDFMTVARKLKGIKKINNAATTDTNLEKTQHSTSQLSYDQRTNNMDALISLLQNTTNYNPNEAEYQVATIQEEKDQMLKSTQTVSSTFVPLNNARSKRNDTIYLSENNLVDTYNRAKDYLFTILDSSSVQYKAISKIKFTKI
jgi:hypothetical protein